MSCGRTPRRRHDGPFRIGGGLSQGKRRGGCRSGLSGPKRQPGKSPASNDAEPWRAALQAGPGTLTPWPCGRTAPLAGAARRNRARGHCRTTDTPQPPHGTASVKASLGTLAASAAAPPVSHSEARIAHYNLPTPRPPRGCAMRLRGAVDRVSASVRSGGLVRIITIRHPPELAPWTTTRSVRLRAAGVQATFATEVTRRYPSCSSASSTWPICER